MIYDIRHLTSYAYGSSVTFTHCALRLLPKDGAGQYVMSATLDIEPSPKELHQRTCFFGNRLTSLTIETPHRQLFVEANVSIEIDREAVLHPKLTPAWEYVRDSAYASASLSPDLPVHFLYPSRFVPHYEPAAHYARTHFSAGRPVSEAAIELMHRMRGDFKYDPKATIISTPLSEAFEKRHGVCQDFAHIMIAALRGIGLPAAYVSGISARFRPKASRVCRAPMLCTPGCRYGAARPAAGSISIRQTIC